MKGIELPTKRSCLYCTRLDICHPKEVITSVPIKQLRNRIKALKRRWCKQYKPYDRFLSHQILIQMQQWVTSNEGSCPLRNLPCSICGRIIPESRVINACPSHERIIGIEGMTEAINSILKEARKKDLIS